ncbi:MAG: NUDIX hydrolase [Proteobacteria bacterium]|nr:MAG: NUDIX hydrolase [Pseudomonadota bacterium]
MSYLEHIQRCNQFVREQFLPFFIGEQCLGLTHKDHVIHLLKWPDVFYVDHQGLHLNPTLNTPESRTDAVNRVVYALHQQGIIESWLSEQYSVSQHFQGDSLMCIERAATAFLGVRGYGIHVNGLVRKKDGIHVWVATRSTHKPSYPGMLDQIVAGGQPAGISLMDNLIKEAAEEAGIPADIATQASFAGEIHYCAATSRGLHNGGIFVYDLWLSEDFVPHNTDGEVASFQLLPIQEVADLVDHTTKFKDNCNLVNIDLFLRLGVINDSHPDYHAIKDALYAEPLTIKPDNTSTHNALFQ